MYLRALFSKCFILTVDSGLSLSTIKYFQKLLIWKTIWLWALFSAFLKVWLVGWVFLHDLIISLNFFFKKVYFILLHKTAHIFSCLLLWYRNLLCQSSIYSVWLCFWRNFLKWWIFAEVTISTLCQWPPISDLAFGSTVVFLHFFAGWYIPILRAAISKGFGPCCEKSWFTSCAVWISGSPTSFSVCAKVYFYYESLSSYKKMIPSYPWSSVKMLLINSV